MKALYFWWHFSSLERQLASRGALTAAHTRDSLICEIAAGYCVPFYLCSLMKLLFAYFTFCVWSRATWSTHGKGGWSDLIRRIWARLGVGTRGNYPESVSFVSLQTLGNGYWLLHNQPALVCHTPNVVASVWKCTFAETRLCQMGQWAFDLQRIEARDLIGKPPNVFGQVPYRWNCIELWFYLRNSDVTECKMSTIASEASPYLALS